jgi:PAS domain S-box-containing protein
MAKKSDEDERKQAGNPSPEINDILTRSPAVAFIWRHAANWPVEYVSNNVQTIFGWHRDDFVTGRISYAQIIFPEDLPRVEKEVRHAAASPAITKFRHEPYRVVARDGSVKWVDDHTTILRDEDGGVAAYEGILLDITDRKLIEKKLRLIEFSVDQAAEGAVWLDADGHLVHANEAECKRLGYSREELLGLSVFDIDSSITPAAWAEKWEELRKADTISVETRHRTKTGKHIRVESSVKFIDFNGAEFCYCISRDITKRKKTEEALARRLAALTRPLEDAGDVTFEDLFDLKDIQRLQDQFAEAVGVASIITHTDGTPITQPSSFCRLCRDIIRKTPKGQINCYNSDAALGQARPDGPIIQPCMSSGLWDAGAGITVGGRHIANWLIGQVRDETQADETMRAYAREIGADETEFIEAFHEVPAMSRDRFASVARVLFTLANQLSTMAYQNVQQARFISERNRAEKEKETLQAQFQQAQKLESVGRLAGGVAHDLNNLLSPILGYSDLLLDDLDREGRNREYAQTIMEAGLRARDIVRQLLAFSRKQTMEVIPIDLNKMLARFQKLLRRTIREDIHIRITSDPSLPLIKGDMGQLEQVVMNMAVNAQDAMPDGGLLSMETALTTLDEEDLVDGLDLVKGAYVTLAINDTGEGMDEETRQHVFEPFFSTKKADGTGLGLATAYGIIKQHGGDIWAYSKPGEGTIFKIYLPASDTAAGEKPPPEPAETPRGTETILLVEDNDQVRKMTANLLSRQGYHVLQAENGKKALELLRNHVEKVQLLLTDVVMPEMNGKDLFLRASEIAPGLRVLYMSGYTNDVIAHRGVLEAGANFIHKPFSIRGLSKKIREALAGE